MIFKLSKWDVYRTLADKLVCTVLAHSPDEATRYASAAYGERITSIHAVEAQ